MTDAKATKAEATETKELELAWEGFTLSLPAQLDEWPLDAVEALETGQVVQLLRQLLGDARYRALTQHLAAKNGRPPKVRDISPLVESIAELYGFVNAGE